MSFQAYLDNIKIKTGKTADDFKTLAAKKGYLKPGVKTGEIVKWLKDEFGLGHGHAMAIVLVLKQATAPPLQLEQKIDRHFRGVKSNWRHGFDDLMNKIGKLGNDIRLSPTDSYISMVKNGRKFAVVQITSNRMDIGIKLKSAPPSGRFESAKKWNSMVTHRVRIADPKEIDAEVLQWLKQAYRAV
ncbi:MAG: DUF4287 domain-containing protein [Bacteroidota bacterium]